MKRKQPRTKKWRPFTEGTLQTINTNKKFSTSTKLGSVIKTVGFFFVPIKSMNLKSLKVSIVGGNNAK